MWKKIARWSVTLAYAVGVYYLSVVPGGGPEFFPYQDKVLHFALYAGLAFLFVWSLRITNLRFWPHVPLLAAALAVAYGALNEVNQLRIPYRSAEFLDVVANTLGAALGACVGALAAKSMEARRLRRGRECASGGGA